MESWQEVLQTSEVKSALHEFMDIFGDYFTIAFPYKLIKRSKTYNIKWITKGIKISSKLMHFFEFIKDEI